jgi:hypothetical protein
MFKGVNTNFKNTLKNNFKNPKYVIIIEVYCIWNDIVFICGYCILLLDFQLFQLLTITTKICNTYVWFTKVDQMCNIDIQGCCFLTSRGQIWLKWLLVHVMQYHHICISYIGRH